LGEWFNLVAWNAAVAKVTEGSNPSLSTSNTQTPLFYGLSKLQHILKDKKYNKFRKCTTFKDSLRHIILRENTYYLCIKIKNKVVRYSLKTKDVEFAKYLRNLILKKLKGYLKMTQEELKKSFRDEFKEANNNTISNMLNDIKKDKYTISYSIDVKPDPNDPNQTEEMAEKIAKQLASKYNLFNNQIATIPEKKDDDKKINYNNIENYFNKYLDHKINIEKRSISSKKSYISSFYYLKFFSNNETIYNFAFFKQFQKNLMIIPSNMSKFKKFEKLKIDEIEKIYKIENFETLSNKTINNHLVNISNFFDDLVYNEIIETNHVKKVKKLEEEESEKIAYSKDDLIKIFNSDIEQELKQFCKVALYTGARIGEIANIKKDDIDFKENIIKIHGTKTKNANRIMPISPHILNILKDRIKINKGQFLFFQDNNVDRIGKILNRRLNKIIIEDVKSFHSFRKNFSQEILKTNAEEHTRKYLMGHSLNKDITHKIYNQNQMNMNKLFECINSIIFNEIEKNYKSHLQIQSPPSS